MKSQISMTLETELVNRIDRLADKEKRSRSSMVAILIEKSLPIESEKK